MKLLGVVLAAATAAILGGCAEPVRYTMADRYERGLVVCLSGAGGMMGEVDRIKEGLAAGGVDRAIETFEWSQGGVLEDQTDVEQNRRKAAQLARRIEAYAAEYPGRPIHLIGVSAGTGLVVWALEGLSRPDIATAAILISSSLDTKYDLTKALANVKERIYSFGSVADTVLSLGVPWAGTVDRQGGLAGGLVGFSPPDNASPQTKALYKDKLVQIGWWPGDVILGHLGDHLGATNPAYVKEKIAPLVLGKAPPPSLVSDAQKDQQARRAADQRLAEARKAIQTRQAEEARKTQQANASAPTQGAAPATAGNVPPPPAAATSAAKPQDAKAAYSRQMTEPPKTVVSAPPVAPGPPPVRSSRGDTKQRFFNWNVGTPGLPPAPAAPQPPSDETRFLSESGRIP